MLIWSKYLQVQFLFTITCIFYGTQSNNEVAIFRTHKRSSKPIILSTTTNELNKLKSEYENLLKGMLFILTSSVRCKHKF